MSERDLIMLIGAFLVLLAVLGWIGERIIDR